MMKRLIIQKRRPVVFKLQTKKLVPAGQPLVLSVFGFMVATGTSIPGGASVLGFATQSLSERARRAMLPTT
jgi:hypothetical protein